MTTENDRIAKEGYPTLAVMAACAVLAFLLHAAAGALLTAVFLFGVSFFRNPRRTPPREGLLAPADGKIIFVGDGTEAHFSDRPMRKISIFMSPFNVHVNRAPESGTVKGTLRRDGKFLAAFDPSAGDENERVAHHAVTDSGDDVVFVQVAGWFARRIVSYLKPGDRIEKGRIFGLIKFGSRMDVFFPASYEVRATVGDKVRAGESVLAARR